MPLLLRPAVAAISALAFGNAVNGLIGVYPEQTRGLVEDIVGRSPLPTHPPGIRGGLPRELAKREEILHYPPQPFICGLVNNNIYDPLTCNNHLATCAQFGNDIGCCTTSLEDCTAVPTTCLGYSDSCDSDCQRDPETLFCYESSNPYCATFFFESTAELYGCYSTSGHTLHATYLSDYYSSALGPDYTTYNDIGITEIPSSTASSSSTTTTASAKGQTNAAAESTRTEDPKDDDGGDDGGLSGGAIAGIVVGVLAIVAAFVAFLVWVFFIKRRNNKNEIPPANPPVQQISPDGGAPPMVGSQQPLYEQPPPPMPYSQQNPNGSGYFQAESKIGPTSPTDPPQYSQPYSPGLPLPGVSEVSGYQAYNPGTSQQPTSPTPDYQSHSQNNSVHVPAGGPAINEMDASNIRLEAAAPAPAHAPAQAGYQLSPNNAGPTEPIYEMPSAR